MKKILLVSLLIAGTSVFAYPGMDMSVGGAPFQTLQEQTFEKEEINSYNASKEAPKIETDVKEPTEKVQTASPSKMRFIRRNGKTQIKYVD